jgi:hypothetical protein
MNVQVSEDSDIELKTNINFSSLPRYKRDK